MSLSLRNEALYLKQGLSLDGGNDVAHSGSYYGYVVLNQFDC